MYGATGEGGASRMRRANSMQAVPVSLGIIAACCLGLLVIGSMSPRQSSPAVLLSAGDAYSAMYRQGAGLQPEGDKELLSREEVLKRLREEILKEGHHILEMKQQERSLHARHALVQTQVKHLLSSSRQSATDMKFLRSRYMDRASELEKQYDREREQLEEEGIASKKRMRELRDKEASLGVVQSTAEARANYYNSQNQQADQNLVMMEDRARIAAEKAMESRKDLDAARRITLEQQVKEAGALSQKKVAKLIAEENKASLRRASRAEGDLANARAHYTEEDAHATAGIAEALEARESVHEAEQRRDALEQRLEKEKDMYHTQVVKIQDLKAHAEIAEDHAHLLERRTDKAEEKLADLKTIEEDTMEKAQEEIEHVERAEAKAAVAKTQGAVVHRLAEADKAAADEQIALIRHALHESKVKLEQSEAAAAQMQHTREMAMVHRTRAVASVRHTDGMLELAKDRKFAARETSREIVADAAHKEAQAENVLHSIGALAALARQAAKVAESARIRAEAAAGITKTGDCGSPSCVREGAT